MREAIAEELKAYSDSWEKYKQFAKDKNALFFQNLVDEAKLTQDKRKIENAEYQKRLDDLTINATDEIKKTKEWQKAKELLKKEHEANLSVIEREENQKRIEERVKMEEQIVAGVKKGLEAREDLEMQAAKNRGQMANSEIMAQAQLAAAGKANILQYELDEQAKALDEQLKLKEKAQKREEALQLASLFLEFQKVNAKDGFGAAAKSLEQTLFSKAISEGFVALFAEEGVKVGDPGAKTTTFDGESWSKTHSGGKDVLVLAEPGEMMLSKADTKIFENLGGLEMLRNPAQHLQTVVLSDFSEVVKKLDYVAEVIKQQPKTIVTKNLQGNLVISDHENGNITSREQINTPIFQRK
jgi:hypothetical protein